MSMVIGSAAWCENQTLKVCTLRL